jgi:hypothetical protein
VDSVKKNARAPYSNFPIVDDGDHEKLVVGGEVHTSNFPIVDVSLVPPAVAGMVDPNCLSFRSKVLVSSRQRKLFPKNPARYSV